VSALRRASAILLAKVPGEPLPLVAAIKERLRREGLELPVVAARLEPRRVRTPDGWRGVEALSGRRVLAFAGIGRPAAFVEVLAGAGADVVSSAFFEDHHRYRGRELEQLLDEARRAGAVPVTTAKDAVKLPEDAPCWVVEVEMVPVAGDWSALWRLSPEVAA
jgi:tetraacyldisaccharide 4'-kinase